MPDRLEKLIAEARELVATSYPIAHDEGCMLDPEFGETNHENWYYGDPLYEDSELPPPHCTCGAEEANDKAADFIEKAEEILK